MNSKFLKAILCFSVTCGLFLMGQNAYANTQITVEEAKKIALDHAKITDTNVFFAKNKLDIDDGITEYELEFFHNNIEYDYEINATTGVVTGSSQEIQKNVAPQNVNMAQYITQAQAKEFAMKHANLTADQVQHAQVEFELEDGQYEYQVNLYTDQAKHEYEMNATTGKIIKSEKEFRQ